MAVLVEGISVVTRAAVVQSKYPGGFDAFVSDCPNRTLCADGELVRVGFMAPDDMRDFVERMDSHGIKYAANGQAVDLVIVDQRQGMAVSCSWAEFGRVSMGEDQTKKVGACRAVDSDIDTLVTPEGWSYEDSLSAHHSFVEPDALADAMDFVRADDKVDVYRDKRTGKLVYVGRPFRS